MLAGWLAADPFRLEIRDDPAENLRRAFLVREHDLPTGLAETVGDAAHCLRASLDHFVYAAVDDGDRAACTFPVGRKPDKRTPEQQRKAVEDAMPTASPALKDRLAAMAPYPDGADEWIWSLHQLDIIDKHHALHVVAARNTEMELDLGSLFGALSEELGSAPDLPPLLLRPNDGWLPSDQPEAEVFTAPPEEFDKMSKTRFKIVAVTTSPETLNREPIQTWLHQTYVRLGNLLFDDLAPLA